MATQKTNSSQQLREFIQLTTGGNQTVTTTATVIPFNTVTASQGTKLTRSGNTVVVGAGVTRVRVSYSIMSDTGGSASYQFSRMRKNSTEVSSAIDATANQFRSTSEDKIIPVTAGDVIDVVVDSGTNTLVVPVGRFPSFTVEVVV